MADNANVPEQAGVEPELVAKVAEEELMASPMPGVPSCWAPTGW